MTTYETIKARIDALTQEIASGQRTPFGVDCARAEIAMLERHLREMPIEQAELEYDDMITGGECV